MDKIDPSSKVGAEALAQRIKRYWFNKRPECMASLAVWTEPANREIRWSTTKQTYTVQSNMRDGYPFVPKKKDEDATE